MRTGLLALLLAAVAGLGLAACGAPPPVDLACPGCSVVLISIDTLRADHLGCYGYPRPTSPRIDRLAAEGVLFENAYAPSYHTADSHMSLFSGLHPSVHRVRNATGSRTVEALPAAVRTLPEALREAGLDTAGFHGGGNVSPSYGFGRGFAEYRATLNDLRPAIDWLERRRAEPRRPFFLFAHTFRTHDPYLPDPPYDRLWYPEYRGDVFSRAEEFAAHLRTDKFEEKRNLFWSRVDPGRPEDVAKIVALYDGAIRQADDEVGALLDAATSLPQRVLVVLVSDHGEEFFEHGGKLHDEVWEETLRVPLVIRHPDGRGAGTRVRRRVGLVDLAPTILEALALEPLPLAQGRPLSRAIRAAGDARPEPVLAEKVVGPPPGAAGEPSLKQALLLGDDKLVTRPGAAGQLFDLAADPGEKLDLRQSRAATAERLGELLGKRNALNRKLREAIPGAAAAVELDDETVERLRALGYL
jgi:arylsulfatase A-like enzyme